MRWYGVAAPQHASCPPVVCPCWVDTPSRDFIIKRACKLACKPTTGHRSSSRTSCVPRPRKGLQDVPTCLLLRSCLSTCEQTSGEVHTLHDAAAKTNLKTKARAGNSPRDAYRCCIPCCRQRGRARLQLLLTNRTQAHVEQCWRHISVPATPYGTHVKNQVAIQKGPTGIHQLPRRRLYFGTVSTRLTQTTTS